VKHAAVFALALFLVGAANGGAARTASPRILFSADRAPLVSGEVYVLRASGAVTDVSRSPWNDQRASLSPDGRRVAFVSDRSGTPAVYTVGADGRGLRRVVRAASVQEDRPLYAWSPDSRTLAIAALGEGEPALARGPLYVVRGSRVRTLATLTGAERLSWTPDGRYLTYLDGVSLVARDAGTGRVAWSRPLRSALSDWTPAGLYAGDGADGTVRVYDTRGQLVERFAGANASWSPDGAYLVLVRGRAIEVRSRSGALLRRVVLRDANVGQQPLWVGTHSLFVAGASAWHVVDVVTGRVRDSSGPYPLVAAVAAPTIAFPAASGHAFAVRVQRGSGPAHTFGRVPGCTDDGALVPAVDELSPAANGSAVVYASRCFEPYGNLYALNGGRVQRLTNARAEQVEAQASPEGTRIAYAQAPAVGLSCKGCPFSIWVANADGSHARQLTFPTESFDGAPTWSPDGSTLLFSRSDPSSFGELYTIPASGGAITDLHVAGAQPAWGPTRIAYLTAGTKAEALWVADPDGSHARRVATGDVAAPAWSRDGRLAFLVGRRGVDIWDGVELRSVPLPFASVSSVAWSPDGTQLAVTARAWGTPAADVYTVGLDGTHVRRLTENLNARDVSWR